MESAEKEMTSEELKAHEETDQYIHGRNKGIVDTWSYMRKACWCYQSGNCHRSKTKTTITKSIRPVHECFITLCPLLKEK